jgi:hypothetical protein
MSHLYGFSPVWVHLCVVSAGKAELTNVTFIWLLACVGLPVHGQSANLGEAQLTHVTLIGLFARVCSHVIDQRGGGPKVLVAKSALVALHTCAGSPVRVRLCRASQKFLFCISSDHDWGTEP